MERRISECFPTKENELSSKELTALATELKQQVVRLRLQIETFLHLRNENL